MNQCIRLVLPLFVYVYPSYLQFYETKLNKQMVHID